MEYISAKEAANKWGISQRRVAILYTLKEIMIKEQHNCKATGYWKTNSVKYNFLLIAHEYLFVFRKWMEAYNGK